MLFLKFYNGKNQVWSQIRQNYKIFKVQSPLSLHICMIAPQTAGICWRGVMGVKENSIKMFVTLPLHVPYFPFSRLIILEFFCLLHLKLAQAREVGQLQNIL